MVIDFSFYLFKQFLETFHVAAGGGELELLVFGDRLRDFLVDRNKLTLGKELGKGEILFPPHQQQHFFFFCGSFGNK